MIGAVRDAAELLWLGTENAFFRSVTELDDLRHYARCPWWWRMRMALGRQYLFDSPYAIVGREGPQSARTDEELIWGETPCSTLEIILHRLEVRPDDVFCDLGCGRGLTVLFAHLRFGLRARGYEILPGFVHKSQAVADALGLEAPAVVFHQVDFLQANLSECTLALLAWTTFPDAVRAAASQRLEQLPHGARVATLTHPLGGAGFTPLGKQRLRFSWGLATVYCYRKD